MSILLRSRTGVYQGACDNARSPEGEGPMTTRREFLGTTAGALAGLAFVGCDLLTATPALAQTQRRQVVVSGKRAKVVDVHAHCAVPEAMALMNLKLGEDRKSVV